VPIVILPLEIGYNPFKSIVSESHTQRGSSLDFTKPFPKVQEKLIHTEAGKNILEDKRKQDFYKSCLNFLKVDPRVLSMPKIPRKQVINFPNHLKKTLPKLSELNELRNKLSSDNQHFINFKKYVDEIFLGRKAAESIETVDSPKEVTTNPFKYGSKSFADIRREMIIRRMEAKGWTPKPKEKHHYTTSHTEGSLHEHLHKILLQKQEPTQNTETDWMTFKTMSTTSYVFPKTSRPTTNNPMTRTRDFKKEEEQVRRSIDKKLNGRAKSRSNEGRHSRMWSEPSLPTMAK